MSTIRIASTVAVLAGTVIAAHCFAAAPIKLSGPFTPLSDCLTNYRISSDGSQVLYLADQETDSVIELYRVPVAGGTSAKVNPALVNGGDVDGAEFSPDGAWIVYRADQDIDEAHDLYSVPSSGGTSVRLNNSSPAGHSVGGQIFPDSSRVAYTADEQGTQVFEVFSVPIGGGVPVKLNGPMVAGGDVFLFDVNSLTDRVFYIGDQDTDNVTELYSVPGSGGTPVKLNGPLDSGRNINAKGVAVSRDGSRAVYLADQNSAGVFELFSVPSDGGTAVPISGSLVNGGDVRQSSIYISPIGDRVIFRADADVDEIVELYSAPVGGGTRTKLNAPLVLNGNVLESSLQFNSDGSRVLYLADQEVDSTNELYVVPSIGGAPLKLNRPLVAGGDVLSAAFNADGSRIVYLADQDVDETFELYSVEPTGDDAAKLNAPLTHSGTIAKYQLTPDGSQVVYLADQEIDQVFELYSVPIAGTA